MDYDDCRNCGERIMRDAALWVHEETEQAVCQVGDLVAMGYDEDDIEGRAFAAEPEVDA